ncbi:hypothetical protein ACFQ08_34615 [Streptosporangium algeriense]|uniref:Uncharacterized protein n=1 Tax=Streptosporangium algeriense TaxID=1682748 RepID=A0ABW3E3Z7_9ACTN
MTDDLVGEMENTSEVYAALAAIAAAARAAYADGSNLRVRSSGIVHEATHDPLVHDERMPSPACMVGVSGWDPGAAHPDCGLSPAAGA